MKEKEMREMLEAGEALELLRVCAAGYAISEITVIWQLT
jgi:hypothetical protein